MADYTDTEVQTAVEKIVRGSIRVEQGDFGEKDVTTTFSDIQEAAAGVFLLYYNAPYYVIYLGTQRLNELVSAELEQIEAVIDAVEALDRLIKPIKDITSLANARSALGALSTAVEERDTGFENFENVPAWRRYAQNVDSFLAEYGGNIKKGGQIVQTPNAARLIIPGLVDALQDSHEELVRRAGLLRDSLADFESLDLPGVAAQGVIERSRTVLGARYDELDALNENERLILQRDITLDLLTQKSIVQEYGAARKPTPWLDLEGTGTAFADSDREAERAYIDSDKFGPYIIVDPDNWIRFTLEGSTVYDYSLPLSYVASVQSSFRGPYVVTADSDELLLEVEGTEYPIPLTNGSVTAETVANDINAVLSGLSARAEAVFWPLKMDTLFNIFTAGGNDASFWPLSGDVSSYGLVVGDVIDVKEGANIGTSWTITSINTVMGYIEATGTLPAIDDPGQRCEVGSTPKGLRLYDVDAAGSVAARRRLYFVPTSGKEDRSAFAIGFAPGMIVQSRPTLPRELAENITETTSTINAETFFNDTIGPPGYYEGSARSEVTDSARVVLVKFPTSDAVSDGGSPVTQLAVTGAQSAGVAAGDIVTIRGSAVADEVGVWSIISAATDNYIEATFVPALAAGDVSIEIGPSMSLSLSWGWSVEITTGPNVGYYYVTGYVSPMEYYTSRALPVFKIGDTAQTFELKFGMEGVRFFSPDKTTASQIEADNVPSGGIGPSDGADVFFTSPPVSANGFTAYIQLPERPEALTVGDILELYEVQYNLVSRSFNIIDIDSDGVITIDGLYESTGSMIFGENLPTPFAKIRVQHSADFEGLYDRLDAWLGRSEQEPSFFSELDRLLNAVLVNKNPTKYAVNDVTTHLKRLAAWLTESSAEAYGTYTSPNATGELTLEYALVQYEVDPVASVTELLKTFKERSADRATDILLEGRFTDFFGLDVESVSYGGELQKKVREVARNDLPVRKFNRQDVFKAQKLIGVRAEKDYEYDISDADKDVSPDAPVGVGGIGNRS